MARASNPENHPNAKTPPMPSKGHTAAADQASIPSQSAHGHRPNFPGEPNPSTDMTDIPGLKRGVDHGWFHA